MGMNALSLKAVLGLDSSEYDSGLKNAESKASSFGSVVGNGFKTIAKVGAAALGAATTAATAFAASSVKTGMTFDKSMSQVAATMGLTMEEMANQVGTVDLAWGTFSGNLREYAQEMGKNTAFSATEAADALNYMALAGYDVQTSMEMLPNVLNLAAAGSMDLARASDMVTDTQTAFGISLERTSQMVDEMAKAASTGNTSVEQLGDAFLVVGGLAQEMSGGMVQLSDGTTATYDNVQELEIALTAMANAGIKGSEAGTHMRNMLLKLASPTKEGVAQFEALGVTVFDSEGKMRSLSDIMGDLNGSLSNLTQEQKLQAISDIFNTRDTAAAEALLSAVGEDWDKIGESILSAQYNITDVTSAIQNASVDWTKYLEEPWVKSSATMGDAWKSLGEQIAYNLQTQKMSVEDTADFIASEYGLSLEDAQKAVESVSDALGDMKGAAQQMADTQLDNLAGDVTLFQSALEGAKIAVSDGLTPSLRQFVQFGTTGLSQITDAFQKGGLTGAMEAFGTVLADGLNMVIDKLPAFVDAGMKLLGALGQGILDNLPVVINAALKVADQLVAGIVQAAPALLDGAEQLLIGLVDGIGRLAPTLIPQAVQMIVDMLVDTIYNIPGLVNAGITLLQGLVDGILNAIPVLVKAVPVLIQGLITALIAAAPALMNGAVKLVQSVVQSLPTIINSLVEAIPGVISLLINGLLGALPMLIQAHVQMVIAIVNALPQIIQALIDAVPLIITSIVDALVNNMPALIEGAMQLCIGIAKAMPTIISAIIAVIPQVVIMCVNAMVSMFPVVLNAIVQLLASIGSTLLGYGATFISNVGQTMSNILSTVVSWLSQLPNQMAYWAGFAIASFIKFFMELPGNIQRWFSETIRRAVAFGSDLKNKAVTAGKSFFNGIVDNIKGLPAKMTSLASQLVSAISSLPSKFTSVGKNIVDGLWNGIKGGWDWLTGKVKDLANSLLDGVKDALGIHSPSRKFAWIGQMIDEGLASGIDKFSYLVDDALSGIMGPTLNMEPQLATAGTNGSYDASAGYNQTVNIYSPTALDPSEVARQTRNATRSMILELRGKR